MRKLAIILTPLLILTLVLITTGCGGEESPTPTPTSVPTSTPGITPTPTSSPAATAEPTSTPATTTTPVPTPTPVITSTPGATSSTALPGRFYGTVQLDGADVPDNTVITAIIQGIAYTTTTPSAYGPSTYAIQIGQPANALFPEGVAVTFKIGDHTAKQTGGWETGGNAEFHLTASTASAQ